MQIKQPCCLSNQHKQAEYDTSNLFDPPSEVIAKVISQVLPNANGPSSTPHSFCLPFESLSPRSSSVESYLMPMVPPKLPTPPTSHSNIPSLANSMSPVTLPNYEGDSAKIVSSAGSNTMQILGNSVSPPYHHVQKAIPPSPTMPLLFRPSTLFPHYEDFSQP